MSEEIEDLGLKATNCNPSCGGKPLCKLGQFTGQHKPKAIQMNGASASEIVEKQRNPLPIPRTYETMIIGDNPIKKDDWASIPFSGEAGDILTEFLVDSGINIDETYITNLVKCCPPKGRKPNTKEIGACLEHVYHEIRQVQPKVIILMGALSLRLFNINKQGGIGKNRGKLFEEKLPHWEDGPTFKIVPTFHPAFFLWKEDARLRSRVLNDFRFAASLVNEDLSQAVIYPCKFVLADTVEKVKGLVDHVLDKRIFAFDTESPDLHLQDSPMRMIQISTGEGETWIIPFYTHNPDALGKWKMDVHFQNGAWNEVRDQLALIFENEAVTKVAHNIKYDMNVLRRWLQLEVKGWLWDTQVMHHLIYEYAPHSLEYLADVEFGCGDYSFMVREIVGHGRDLRCTYDNIPDEILNPYGATDAEMTFRLLDVYYELLKKKPGLMQVYNDECYHSIRTLQEAEWAGNHIIVGNIDKLEKVYTQELEDLLISCRRYTTPTFLPTSPKQVGEAFVKLGFSNEVVAPLTSTGYSTGKEVLMEIDHPLAQNVLDYRNRTKMLSTYVVRAKKDLDLDGRLRYGFNQTGTVNGGLSCRFLHQVPRIDEDQLKQGKTILRSIFGEEDDFLYFYGDYSQIELRIFAYLTGQQELIDILENNGDIHAATAAAALQIAIEDVSPFNRSGVGKPLNFGVIFGSEGYQMAKSIYEDPKTGQKRILGIKKAVECVINFRKRYDKVDEYLTIIPERALCANGVLDLRFGRERRIMGLNDADERRRGKAEREATNATIQAPARAITIRTASMIRIALENAGVSRDKVRFLNTVHDSLAYGVHKDLKDWFPPLFKRIAERRMPEIENKWFPIKWGYGDTWTEAELNAN